MFAMRSAGFDFYPANIYGLAPRVEELKFLHS